MEFVCRVKNMLRKIFGGGDPVEVSRRLGVAVGENCRFMGVPVFGSEPWLIEIGNNCLITAEVQFITHDGSVRVLRRVDSKYKSIIKFGKIVVEDGAFIGRRSVIMPNVKIGRDSIVAACSCVTKDVPPRTVVEGVPARVIATIDEVAEKWYHNTPTYDNDELQKNKKKVSTEIAEHYWNLKH